MPYHIVNPVAVRMRESEKGSIYQSIVAIGFRARQINDQIKSQLNEELADVIDGSDTEGTNFDQIAISRKFDNFPKPTFIAMKEISEGKLHFTLPEPEAPQEEASS